MSPRQSAAELCAMLGYEKGNSDKNQKTLVAAISNFLDQFPVATRSPTKTRRPKTSRNQPFLHAANFLNEDDRGETLWPASSGNRLCWKNDKDQITIHVTELFRLRAHARITKQNRGQKPVVVDRTDKMRNSPEYMSAGTTREDSPYSQGEEPSADEAYVDYEGDKRKVVRRTVLKQEDSEDEEVETDVEPNVECLDRGWALKTWCQPSSRFNIKACIQYLKDLEPAEDDETVGWLTRGWLNDILPPWPPLAEKEVQRFMHKHEYYYSEMVEESRIAELVDVLRLSNPEIRELEEMEEQNLHRKVMDRIKLFTGRFLEQNFIETEVEEPRMTERFRKAWNSFNAQQHNQHRQSPAISTAKALPSPTGDTPIPRKRGRPRIHPLSTDGVPGLADTPMSINEGRNRKRKKPNIYNFSKHRRDAISPSRDGNSPSSLAPGSTSVPLSNNVSVADTAPNVAEEETIDVEIPDLMSELKAPESQRIASATSSLQTSVQNGSDAGVDDMAATMESACSSLSPAIAIAPAQGDASASETTSRAERNQAPITQVAATFAELLPSEPLANLAEMAFSQQKLSTVRQRRVSQVVIPQSRVSEPIQNSTQSKMHVPLQPTSSSDSFKNDPSDPLQQPGALIHPLSAEIRPDVASNSSPLVPLRNQSRNPDDSDHPPRDMSKHAPCTSTMIQSPPLGASGHRDNQCQDEGPTTSCIRSTHTRDSFEATETAEVQLSRIASLVEEFSNSSNSFQGGFSPINKPRQSPVLTHGNQSNTLATVTRERAHKPRLSQSATYFAKVLSQEPSPTLHSPNMQSSPATLHAQQNLMQRPASPASWDRRSTSESRRELMHGPPPNTSSEPRLLAPKHTVSPLTATKPDSADLSSRGKFEVTGRTEHPYRAAYEKSWQKAEEDTRNALGIADGDSILAERRLNSSKPSHTREMVTDTPYVESPTIENTHKPANDQSILEIEKSPQHQPSHTANARDPATAGFVAVDTDKKGDIKQGPYSTQEHDERRALLTGKWPAFAPLQRSVQALETNPQNHAAAPLETTALVHSPSQVVSPQLQTGTTYHNHSIPATRPRCGDGGDCAKVDCPSIHLRQMCKGRGKTCRDPGCPFQHGEGRQRGKPRKRNISQAKTLAIQPQSQQQKQDALTKHASGHLSAPSTLAASAESVPIAPTANVGHTIVPYETDVGRITNISNTAQKCDSNPCTTPYCPVCYKTFHRDLIAEKGKGRGNNISSKDYLTRREVWEENERKKSGWTDLKSNPERPPAWAPTAEQKTESITLDALIRSRYPSLEIPVHSSPEWDVLMEDLQQGGFSPSAIHQWRENHQRGSDERVRAQSASASPLSPSGTRLPASGRNQTWPAATIQQLIASQERGHTPRSHMLPSKTLQPQKSTSDAISVHKSDPGITIVPQQTGDAADGFASYKLNTDPASACSHVSDFAILPPATSWNSISTSTSLPSSTLPAPQASPRTLEFFFQNPQKSIDTSRPYSFHSITNLPLPEFLSLISSSSATPIAAIQTVTLQLIFGSYQSYVVAVGEGEKGWEKVRRRLGKFWDFECQRWGGGDDEEVHVCVGEMFERR